MDFEPLPSTWVFEEARAYLRTARLVERHAADGDTALYWPAVMNSALASELYIKSFLVEADPQFPSNLFDPDGHLRLVSGLSRVHDLLALYKAIPADLAQRLRETSEQLSPGFPLEKSIADCSALFVGTRYPYEAKSAQAIDLDVLNLAPHLDRVIAAMTEVPAHDTAQNLMTIDPQG